MQILWSSAAVLVYSTSTAVYATGGCYVFKSYPCNKPRAVLLFSLYYSQSKRCPLKTGLFITDRGHNYSSGWNGGCKRGNYSVPPLQVHSAMNINCLFYVNWFFEKIDIAMDSFAVSPTIVYFAWRHLVILAACLLRHLHKAKKFN